MTVGFYAHAWKALGISFEYSEHQLSFYSVSLSPKKFGENEIRTMILRVSNMSETSAERVNKKLAPYGTDRRPLLPDSSTSIDL